MELVKTSELPKLLTDNEWVVVYIKAPWCKVCTANEAVIEEVVQETPDIKIVSVMATDPDNESILRSIDLESLPYYAVFHRAKGAPEDPMSCFAGGDSGGGKELPTEIVTMIRQFTASEAGVQ